MGLRGQLSVEYIFAVFAWVLVCTSFAYVANSYVSEFSSASSETANFASIARLSEIAGSDLDGMKYFGGNYYLEGNLTFNNTLASLKTGGGEHIASSGIAYAYPEEIQKGDRMLIKNQGGMAIVAKVS